MKNILRIIIIFYILILGLFVSSNKVCAQNIGISALSVQNYISQSKPEITLFNGFENYYAISQNNSNKEIITGNNKNNNSDVSFDNQNTLYNNNSKYFNIKSSNITNNRIFHNISPNLKNAIYTRAP